jgi:hypothetical protein
MQVVGLDLDGDLPADAVTVGAVLIVDLIGQDSKRVLHILTSEMPLWTQVGMVTAMVDQLRAELARDWEGDD